MAEHLSAAQLTAIEKMVNEKVGQVIAALNLRKVAMQFAVDSKAIDPALTAEQIYTFLCEPMAEVVVRIEQ